MRWNKRERSWGMGAAVAAMIAAFLVAEPSEVTAARVQAGMTPAEVALALGNTGTPSEYVCFNFTKELRYYRDYLFLRGTVVVLFMRGVDGNERVVSAMTQRQMSAQQDSPIFGEHEFRIRELLVIASKYWSRRSVLEVVALAALVWLLAAECARRRRPTPTL